MTGSNCTNNVHAQKSCAEALFYLPPYYLKSVESGGGGGVLPYQSMVRRFNRDDPHFTPLPYLARRRIVVACSICLSIYLSVCLCMREQHSGAICQIFYHIVGLIQYCGASPTIHIGLYILKCHCGAENKKIKKQSHTEGCLSKYGVLLSVAGQTH